MSRQAFLTLTALILLAASASRGQDPDPAAAGAGAAVDSAATGTPLDSAAVATAPVDSFAAPGVDSSAIRALTPVEERGVDRAGSGETESFVLLVKPFDEPLSTTYRIGDAQIRIWTSSMSSIQRAGIARVQHRDLVPLLARAASIPEEGNTGTGVEEGDVYVLVRHPGRRVAAWIESRAPDELLLLIGEVGHLAAIAQLGTVQDPAFRARPIGDRRTRALEGRGVLAVPLMDFPPGPQQIVSQAIQRPYEFFAARPEYIADFRRSFPSREFYVDPGDGSSWVQIEAWDTPGSYKSTVPARD